MQIFNSVMHSRQSEGHSFAHILCAHVRQQLSTTQMHAGHHSKKAATSQVVFDIWQVCTVNYQGLNSYQVQILVYSKLHRELPNNFSLTFLVDSPVFPKEDPSHHSHRGVLPLSLCHVGQTSTSGASHPPKLSSFCSSALPWRSGWLISQGNHLLLLHPCYQK